MRTATASPWRSANGVAIADRVPAETRAAWTAAGLCPGRDLYALFRDHVRAAPAREAVIDEAGALDYAALDDRVRRAAAALRAAGRGSADIIAVLLPNGRDAVVAELAIAAIGAVALPIPHTHRPRDIASLLGRSRAAALITAPETAAAAEGHPGLHVWTPGTPPSGGIRSLDEALGGEERAWRPEGVDPEAPARILVSSGSESEPKMVAYSHNAMAGGRGNYVAALRRGPEPMRALVLVSLASSYGSLATSVIVARHGGTLVLLPRFGAAAALDAVERHRPTHLFGVPTMLWRMGECGTGADVSSLHAVVSSAGPVHRHVHDACVRRFGMPPVNIYGSSDGVNCHTGRDPSRWEPGLAGVPDPDVARIGIRDPEGRPLPPGQAGEIWALGPMTPLCYVAAPDLDARYRAPGGWVRTGDLGRLDADGTLWVLDRLKRIVIRGGIGISPAEVERALLGHPGVADAHCVPVSDRDLGERMCACLAPRPGAPPPSPAELIAYLLERGLDRRGLPERFLMLPELPLGPTGKVDVSALTRAAAEAAVTADGAGHPGQERR
ncbi:long-chain fatty acid--CoA ligase [Actinomadura sp. KC345]|uniref:class I adenylate-forming enzyme family protein n=1 Tax=Actinomadura sp. KC345 TaxID=2530371 RepID=UPI001045812F|nr:class I adenylate-forming enzyme family protein [Actinomadura sp. KC345]TDC46671.1 long-chain fatty acid--CoA ligase [Actinomadura sp. KC345]